MDRSMSSIIVFAIAMPLFVLVVVCCRGFLGERVNRRRYAIRDVLVLLTTVAIGLGLAATVLPRSVF
jgi:hypothetical protein